MKRLWRYFLIICLFGILLVQQVFGGQPQPDTIRYINAWELIHSVKPQPIGQYLYYEARIQFPEMVHWKRIQQSGLSQDSLQKFSKLKFTIRNPRRKDTLQLLLHVGKQAHLKLLHVSAIETERLSPDGFEANIPLQKFQEEEFGFHLLILPNSQYTYWLEHTGMVYPERFFPMLVDYGVFCSRQNSQFMNRGWLLGFIWFVMGVCILLSLFGFFMYASNRQRVYLYWGAYLGANALFFLFMSDFLFALPKLPYIGLIIPSQHLIALFWPLFLGAFFDIRTTAPRLHRFSIGLAISISIFLVISLLLTQVSLKTWLFTIDDKPFLVLQVGLLFVLFSCFTLPVPNKRFIIIGSLCMLLMSVVAVYVDISGLTNFNYFWNSPVAIYGTGVFLELFFLIVALSERARAEDQEKQKIQKALEQERLQFERRMTETEMATLRSQMNPHFIFNCLNSIQYFTARNESDKASEYLTKFSRLIRLVLENSKSEKVTLANELETLRLYMDMEAMRFPQKLSYTIQVSEMIEVDAVQIPPLLLQPFVENAIWHGLMHKDKGGMVRITVEQNQDDLLHVEITDDGVGRQKSMEFKSRSAIKNKSFGMKITADRIELINQLYQTQTQVHITDLTDEHGRVIGTCVVIEIPV